MRSCAKETYDAHETGFGTRISRTFWIGYLCRYSYKVPCPSFQFPQFKTGIWFLKAHEIMLNKTLVMSASIWFLKRKMYALLWPQNWLTSSMINSRLFCSPIHFLVPFKKILIHACSLSSWDVGPAFHFNSIFLGRCSSLENNRGDRQG